MNWHVCTIRLVSVAQFKASSTVANTPLSEITNGCQGIANHLIPPSEDLETSVPSPDGIVRSKVVLMVS